jgi:hypothetical protein
MRCFKLRLMNGGTTKTFTRPIMSVTPNTR